MNMLPSPNLLVTAGVREVCRLLNLHIWHDIDVYYGHSEIYRDPVRVITVIFTMKAWSHSHITQRNNIISLR